MIEPPSLCDARLNASGELEVIESNYDWTCSSKFWGRVLSVTKNNSGLDDKNSNTDMTHHHEAYQSGSGDRPQIINPLLDSRSRCDQLGHHCSRILIDSDEPIHQLSGMDPGPIPLDLLTNTSIPILWFQQVGRRISRFHGILFSQCPIKFSGPLE